MARAPGKKSPKKMGRPSLYSEAMAERICELIAEGVPVHKIAERNGMPSERAIYQWLSAHAEFAQDYTRAREAYAHRLASEVIEIGDEAPETIKGVEKAALRCRNRIWAAERMAPKKYGALTRTELTGADGGAIKTEQRVDLSGLSDAALAELAAKVGADSE